MYACTDDPASMAAPPDASFSHDGSTGIDLHLDPGGTTRIVTVNGALWQYPVPLGVGTGVINPFLSVQATGIESGFNTDASPLPLDDTRSQFTDPLPLNFVPVIVEPGQGTTLWREFILDANESDSGTDPKFAIRVWDLWMCDDANAPNYDTTSDFTANGDCVKVYGLSPEPGGVLRATTEFTSGSGKTLDYRILVPNSAFTAALASLGQSTAACPYQGVEADPCGIFLVLNTTMGSSGETGGNATYITGATFEEYSTVERPVQLLTIVKQIVNDNGGTATVGNFAINTTAGTLVFGAGVTSGSTTTYTAAQLSIPEGTFSLVEGTVAGYTNGTWSCVGATSFVPTFNAGSVTIAADQTVTCTIVNNDISPRLTLVKVVTNDNGGTATPGNFTLTAAGPQTISGAGGTSSNVNAGTYALSETTVAGYAAGSWVCVGGSQTGSSIALAVAQSATCTIANNDVGARLTLVKVVTNNNGGTATPGNFTLTAAGPQTISGPGGTSQNVSAGTYALSETTVAGYAPSSWVCVGGSQSGSSIALALAQSATCTIGNDDITARLTLVKVVTNDNGGTATPGNFTLTAAGPQTVSGAGPTVGPTNVNAGTYALSETTLAGYSASAWVCVGGSQSGSSIALALAQSATCTIGNDDNLSRLTLVKVVTNDNGGTATPGNFTLTAAGPQTISGPGGTSQFVSAGTYALSETTVAGYAAGSWVCVGGTQSGSSIAIALSQSATCTIANNDIPARLTLVKVVTNDNGGTATPGNFTLTAAGPQTISGAGGTASNVLPGTYALSETTVAGYAAGSFVCVGGSQSGSSIALALAQSATCTIANNDVAARLTLVKVVTNDNGGTATPGNFTLTAAGPQTISGAGGTTSAVNPGTYALSETTLAGYAAGSWLCVGGSQSGSSIALALAQSATCTIANNDIALIEETAWAANGNTPGQLPFNPGGQGSWATYVSMVGQTNKTVTIFAGQTDPVGTANFTVVGSCMRITVTLTDGSTFVSGSVVKVQTYSSAPSGNPSPGQFDFTIVPSSATSATSPSVPPCIPIANFYAVHMNVVP